MLAVQALHWMEPTRHVRRGRPPAATRRRVRRARLRLAALGRRRRAEQAWHTARATVAIHERRLAGWCGRSIARRAASSSPQSDDLRPVDPADAAAAVTIIDGVQFWHKGEHLGRMIASQQFQHCVEIAALGEERGDADRFVQLFCSQGDYQALRRHGLDDATLGVDTFADRGPRTCSARESGRSGSPIAPASACATRSARGRARIVRLVIARCSVDYAGRLTAHLPEAVRLIMVKADGCVAIHADGGAYKPLNWMNAPNVLVIGEGAWTVTNPKGESLTITMHEVLSDTEAESRRRSGPAEGWCRGAPAGAAGRIAARHRGRA